MNRLRHRARGAIRAAAPAAALAVALAGCSAGQVTQTSMQEPAVNGNRAGVGALALRDVYLEVADQQGDFVRPPQQVGLRFVVTNDSADQPDQLVSITSPVGEVGYVGQRDIPETGLLVVGEPEDIVIPPDVDLGLRRAGTATVTVAENITNGLLYDVTFTFARAGAVELSVPVAAGVNAPRRGPSPGDGPNPTMPNKEDSAH